MQQHKKWKHGEIEDQQKPYLENISLHIKEKQNYFLNEIQEDKALTNIRKLLKTISLENILDPKINKSKTIVIIKLRDPNKIIRVKPMIYTPEDRIEFGKQIEELLELKVIIPSNSPHSSRAFLIEKKSEKRRGKKRMVINFKALNKKIIDDGYIIPKKEELLSLIKGKKYFSSFDCKSGF